MPCEVRIVFITFLCMQISVAFRDLQMTLFKIKLNMHEAYLLISNCISCFK